MTKFKRLFFDIEVSPNIVTSWNIGRKINIDYHNIVKERAIITVCWKWEGENKIHNLNWNKGDDKKLVQEFAKIINSADEVIGHNGDQFDIKWFRTRCILHGVSIIPDIQSVDTLKLARKGFRFNSNRLDYIAKYLGVGRKIKTEPDLWSRIIFNNEKKALDDMVKYCKMDVEVLEKVFQKLDPYCAHKSHKAVAEGGEPHHCPKCSSKRVISNGVRTMANGLKKRRMQCVDCGGYFTISNAVYEAIKPILK